MHVRGITCQQHTAAAIGRRLARSIGPCRGQVQCSDRCLAARHPPQQRLRGVPVQWRAMARATVEIGQRQQAWRVEIAHPVIGELSARCEYTPICQFDQQRVTGELRPGSSKDEARLLAYRAAGPITTDQPAAVDPAGADVHGNLRLVRIHRLYRTPAFDAHAQRNRTFGQYRFQGLQLHRHLSAHWRRQAPAPARAVDVVQRKRNAGEVAPQRPRLRQPMGGAQRRRALVGLEHLSRDDRVQQATPIQCLQRGDVQAAQPEWQALQRRISRPGLFQHQYRTPGMGQFAGQEQANRASTGNDDVVQHGDSL